MKYMRAFQDNFWDEQIFGDLNEGAHDDVCQTEQQLDVTSTDTNVDAEHEAFLLLQRYVRAAKLGGVQSKQSSSRENGGKKVQAVLAQFKTLATHHS